MSQLKLLWTWEWKNKEEDHLEIKRHKHCLGPIANKTFRGLDVVHLQKEAYCSVHFSDILILLIPYRYLTSLLTDMYIHVAVTASPSFLPGSTLGRVFIPDTAAIITASTWPPFFRLSRTVITGATKAHIDSLGLCLLILQHVHTLTTGTAISCTFKYP